VLRAEGPCGRRPAAGFPFRRDRLRVLVSDGPGLPDGPVHADPLAAMIIPKTGRPRPCAALGQGMRRLIEHACIRSQHHATQSEAGREGDHRTGKVSARVLTPASFS